MSDSTEFQRVYAAYRRLRSNHAHQSAETAALCEHLANQLTVMAATAPQLLPHMTETIDHIDRAMDHAALVLSYETGHAVHPGWEYNIRGVWTSPGMDAVRYMGDSGPEWRWRVNDHDQRSGAVLCCRGTCLTAIEAIEAAEATTAQFWANTRTKL